MGDVSQNEEVSMYISPMPPSVVSIDSTCKLRRKLNYRLGFNYRTLLISPINLNRMTWQELNWSDEVRWGKIFHRLKPSLRSGNEENQSNLFRCVTDTRRVYNKISRKKNKLSVRTVLAALWKRGGPPAEGAVTVGTKNGFRWWVMVTWALRVTS